MGGDQEPDTLRPPHRALFIPSDYRLAPVIGWKSELGFFPDEGMVNVEAGFLVYVNIVDWGMK